ncbi:hypothetical protein ACLMJK_002131 [Lecanora helva]
MTWWNELWLNESFATLIGWLAIDHFHPTFEVWSQFVVEAVQTSQNLDSLRSSHPIEVPVRDALEVEQIFDAISYLKGSSVLRMLSNHLGMQTFLNGVAAYLKRHAYGNATGNDLWSALSEASGKNVTEFMDPWIRKIGFPVLTVAEEPGQIGIRQSRFLQSGDVGSEEDETLWWVPLGLISNTESTGADSTALTIKEETLRNIDETFYKFNSNQNGFYRTNYPPGRLTKLGADRARLSAEDKVGLVADAAAMAIAGQGTTAGLLALVEQFKDESNKSVWAQIITSISHIRSVFADSKTTSDGLKYFTQRLVASATEDIRWDFTPQESFLSGQLRALLINSAGSAGHEKTTIEALRRFDAYMQGDQQAIHPSLRLAIFSIAIRERGQSAYKAVLDEYKNTTSIDGKETCLMALGKVQTLDLAEDFLNFQFSSAVAAQDLHTGSISLANNPQVRTALWNYIKQNWDTVYKKLSVNPVVMDRYLKTTLSKFASHEVERDIDTFFKDKDTKGYDRGLVQVADTIKANAIYRERDEDIVVEWLKAHGYS